MKLTPRMVTAAAVFEWSFTRVFQCPFIDSSPRNQVLSMIQDDIMTDLNAPLYMYRGNLYLAGIFLHFPIRHGMILLPLPPAVTNLIHWEKWLIYFAMIIIAIIIMWSWIRQNFAILTYHHQQVRPLKLDSVLSKVLMP